MSVDDDVRALASEQYGVVGRSQVRSMGGDRWWEAHRVATGAWSLASPNVLVLVGSPRTDVQRVMIGLCEAGEGATVSHDTAAWLWGLYGFAPTPVHVTALRGTHRRRSALIVVHEPRRLFPTHITVAEGFAITSIVRTVFDLAPSLHPARIRQLVHAVLRRAPSLLSTFHSMLAELAVRGKPGIHVMRETLAALPPGSVPAESNVELRASEILKEAGEQPLRRQVNRGGQEFIGRVDLVDDALDIVFEIDSRTYHLLLPADRERDAVRDAAFDALGTRVVRVPETIIWRAPMEWVRIVRRERAARRAQLELVAGA